MTEVGHNDIAAVRLQLESVIAHLDGCIDHLVEEGNQRIAAHRATWPEDTSVLSVYQDERLRQAIASKAEALAGLVRVLEVQKS